MYERTHIDLFSGIGGFALAASWCGVWTVQFVEIDRRCRDFLARAWPGVPIHDDIRTYRGQSGAWLLTAGVPCQPASRAGKRLGRADHRWLWPEALRCLAEIRPAWALFENPPGIGDVGLAGILAEMEAVGYAVRVFSIPACACGAPHRREQYWIVGRLADSSRGGLSGSGLHLSERGSLETVSVQSGAVESGYGVDMADAGGAGREGHRGDESIGSVGREEQGGHGAASTPRGTESDMAYAEATARVSLSNGKEHESPASNGRRDSDVWGRYVWLPCADGKFRRAPDDSFGLVDGLHRSILGALGNSIVPALAAKIINAMVLAEEEE